MNIYVANLSFHISGEDLRYLFEQFGDVSSAKVIADSVTGRSRGFGFVEMGADEEAKSAIVGLNNKEFEGRAIIVAAVRSRA